MGLDVSVGLLGHLRAHDEEGAGWFLEDLERLNTVLQAAGLDRHDEPGDAKLLSLRIGSYSTLHELRRVAAHLQYSGKPPGSRSKDVRPWDDAFYDRYFASFDQDNPDRVANIWAKQSTRRFDHLMVHSDAEGLYVPQRFDSVLMTGGEVYGCVGSSFALLSECEELAQALQIPESILLDEDDRVFVEAYRALDRPPSMMDRLGRFFQRARSKDAWRHLPVAASVCVKLHQAAQHSIRSGSAIVFQ